MTKPGGSFRRVRLNDLDEDHRRLFLALREMKRAADRKRRAEDEEAPRLKRKRGAGGSQPSGGGDLGGS